MEYICMLAAGFLAGGSRQEKASVRLPCSGKKLAANWLLYLVYVVVKVRTRTK